MSSGIIDLRAGGRPRPRVPPVLKTPRTPAQRPLPLRARRRRTRALAIAAIFVALIAAMWGVSYLSYLPQYAVQVIEVRGTDKLPESLVRTFVDSILYDGRFHVLSRQNMLLFPHEEIERGVTTFFPRIKSTDVSRAALAAGTITVTIRERVPFARWCTRLPVDSAGSQSGARNDEKCYYMDEGGFIFAQRPEESGTTADTMTPYVFRGDIATTTAAIGQRFALTHLAGLIALLNSLGQSGYHPEGITLESDDDFAIPLGEGFLVKASFGSQPVTLVRNLDLVLSSEALRDARDKLEYVDLRFGNKVYYKMKGEEAIEVP